jgi:hypothetical protein
MRSGPSVSSGIFCCWLVPAGRITSRIEKISPVHWPMSMSSAGVNNRKTTDARTPDNVVRFRVNLPRQIDLIGGAHLARSLIEIIIVDEVLRHIVGSCRFDEICSHLSEFQSPRLSRQPGERNAPSRLWRRTAFFQCLIRRRVIPGNLRIVRMGMDWSGAFAHLQRPAPAAAFFLPVTGNCIFKNMRHSRE